MTPEQRTLLDVIASLPDEGILLYDYNHGELKVYSEIDIADLKQLGRDYEHALTGNAQTDTPSNKIL